MAAPYSPPVKNEDFVIRIGLSDLANPGRLKASATIAAGDFKVDKDGGGFTNLSTLPSVDPAGSKSVLITLSATEMNADVVTIVCADQTSPPEWGDVEIAIQTVTALDIISDVDTAINNNTNLTVIRTQQQIIGGTAQGAGTGLDTLQLEAGQITTYGGNEVWDPYNYGGQAFGFIVVIVEGAGKGQQRMILETVEADDEIQVMGGAWETPVDNTSVYVIFGN